MFHGRRLNHLIDMRFNNDTNEKKQRCKEFADKLLAVQPEVGIFPDQFDLYITSTVEDSLRETLSSKHPVLQQERIDKLVFLTLNFSFLENNCLHLLRQKQPHTNHGRITEYILNCYKQYVLTAELPSFDELALSIRLEIPRFGTPQQWMNFLDSLGEFYNGKPETYVQNMLILNQEPVKE